MDLADIVPEEEDSEALVGIIPESGNHLRFLEDARGKTQEDVQKGFSCKPCVHNLSNIKFD